MTDDDEVTEGAVTPEELRLEDNDHVVPLDNNRYLVSPNLIDESTAERIQAAAGDDEETPESEGTTPDPPQPTLDIAAARAIVERSVATVEGEYAFEVTAKVEGSVTRHRTVTNDVTTAFDRLLLWFAHQVSEDTPVEEVLGILLLESSIPVTFPNRGVGNLLESHDLDAADSIADLLVAVGETLESRHDEYHNR